MEKYVDVMEFACRECKYHGCEHNEEGFCWVDDDVFLWDRIENLRDGDIYFICERQYVKPGYCEFCGTKLRKVLQIRDKKRGDKYEWICPECDLR
ncbi:MAG: hypothetical protein ACOCZ5_01830 [bacterium]